MVLTLARAQPVGACAVSRLARSGHSGRRRLTADRWPVSGCGCLYFWQLLVVAFEVPRACCCRQRRPRSAMSRWSTPPEAVGRLRADRAVGGRRGLDARLRPGVLAWPWRHWPRPRFLQRAAWLPLASLDQHRALGGGGPIAVVMRGFGLSGPPRPLWLVLADLLPHAGVHPGRACGSAGKLERELMHSYAASQRANSSGHCAFARCHAASVWRASKRQCQPGLGRGHRGGSFWVPTVGLGLSDLHQSGPQRAWHRSAGSNVVAAVTGRSPHALPDTPGTPRRAVSGIRSVRGK